MSVLSAKSSLTERIDNDLNKLFEKYGTTRAALMPILQEMNENYNYIGEYIIMKVAEILDMSATEVYGVASFYHFLRTEPIGDFVISVSDCTPCVMAGNEKIIKVLENELGIKLGETSSDGKFTLEKASCIGLCDQAPAMLINNDAYTDLTPEKVVEILKNYR